MDPRLADLIARGRLTGSIIFDEVIAVAPEYFEPDQLDTLQKILDAEGIALIDSVEPPAGEETQSPSSTPATLLTDTDVADLLDCDILGGNYHRDAEFDKLLRENGVRFSDAACSFESDNRIFDAEVIVPGEHALSAWLALRNLVPATRLWPVIGRDPRIEPSSFDSEPSYLDPRRRRDEWFRASREVWQRDPNADIPAPEITPETIRADAAANIAAADKIPPTPWRFRGRTREDPAMTGEDSPLTVHEPNLAELFSNSGPFRCVREGPDYPFPPFMRIRLYPTANPWEVFAYSPYGGWNDAPYPDEQLSMLRHWHSVCGAEIVSVPGDWYELFVPNPPRTRHRALRLLHEMGWFGEETIFGHKPADEDTLVEQLRTSHYWYFWWD
jgi:hypothetical protein